MYDLVVKVLSFEISITKKRVDIKNTIPKYKAA